MEGLREKLFSVVSTFVLSGRHLAGWWEARLRIICYIDLHNYSGGGGGGESDPIDPDSADMRPSETIPGRAVLLTKLKTSLVTSQTCPITTKQLERVGHPKVVSHQIIILF